MTRQERESRLGIEWNILTRGNQRDDNTRDREETDLGPEKGAFPAICWHQREIKQQPNIAVRINGERAGRWNDATEVRVLRAVVMTNAKKHAYSYTTTRMSKNEQRKARTHDARSPDKRRGRSTRVPRTSHLHDGAYALAFCVRACCRRAVSPLAAGRRNRWRTAAVAASVALLLP